MYVRKCTIPIREVLVKLFSATAWNKPLVFGKDTLRSSSLRYQTFLRKGTKCVACGIEGNFFALERHAQDKRYHLNLYATIGTGERLMTKDHIMPKSKGGADNLNNLQPMCSRCNRKKADKIPSNLNS